MSYLFLIAHLMRTLIKLWWVARKMPLTSVFRESEYLFTRNRFYIPIHTHVSRYTSDTVPFPTQLFVGSHERHKIFLLLLYCVTTSRRRPALAQRLSMFNNSERTNDRTSQRASKRRIRAVVPSFQLCAAVRVAYFFVHTYIYFSLGWV